MRLRMKLWPQGLLSAMSAPSSGRFGAAARRFFSWQGLGAALLGVMLANWTWVLLAPASPAMPAAAWEAADDAGRLFGTARVADAQSFAPMGNIKLIGVFAHRTKGFAVMQVEDKQIGVAQGEDVKPGIRLAETYADHVMLEQAGVRQRVDISGASAPSGMSGPPAGMAAGITAPPAVALSSPAALPGHTMASGAAPAPVPQGQIDALQQQLDAAGNMPPERREMLKHKLDQMQMRGQH